MKPTKYPIPKIWGTMGQFDEGTTLKLIENNFGEYWLIMETIEGTFELDITDFIKNMPEYGID